MKKLRTLHLRIERPEGALFAHGMTTCIEQGGDESTRVNGIAVGDRVRIRKKNKVRKPATWPNDIPVVRGKGTNCNSNEGDSATAPLYNRQWSVNGEGAKQPQANLTSR